MTIEVRADNKQIVIKMFGTEYWFSKYDAMDIRDALEKSIMEVIATEAEEKISQ